MAPQRVGFFFLTNPIWHKNCDPGILVINCSAPSAPVVKPPPLPKLSTHASAIQQMFEKHKTGLYYSAPYSQSGSRPIEFADVRDNCDLYCTALDTVHTKSTRTVAANMLFELITQLALSPDYDRLTYDGVMPTTDDITSCALSGQGRRSVISSVTECASVCLLLSSSEKPCITPSASFPS